MSAAMPGSEKGHGSVKLQAKELMTAMPSMSREEKKNLQKALMKEDEEKQAHKDLQFAGWQWDTISPPSFAGSLPMRDVIRFHLSRSVVGAVVRKQLQVDSQLWPRPPPKDDSVPKAMRDRELKTFREGLYAKQKQGDRLIPSKAAPMPTEEQAQRKHPLNS